MFENLQWQKDHMRLNDLLFRLEPCVEGWKEGQHYFRLFKEKRMYDQYESIFSGRPGFQARNILEIGIWDGGDEIVLLRQSHDSSFEKELIDDLAQYFKHPNYIRVKGRPIFTARAIAKSAQQNSAVNPAPSTALSLSD